MQRCGLAIKNNGIGKKLLAVCKLHALGMTMLNQNCIHMRIALQFYPQGFCGLSKPVG